MIFNSFAFTVFCIVVFFVYYFILKGKTRMQNILLLASSYFYYGCADIQTLPLLLVTTLFFYFLGLYIPKLPERKDSFFTIFGIIAGIGVLMYFKYLNFFIESFAQLFEQCGLQTNLNTYDIILPVGISFFIFRLISYIIEIHRRKIEPTRNFVDFAVYVSFFPCILSGPIDRPNTFIPQLQKKRTFNYEIAIDGIRQILWGLFKKVVVADNLALIVNNTYECYSTLSGSSLLLGAILFTFQLYADFSGYSDIAIGIGKLFGFQIANNFKYPLFALNIADFWKRWHISLTSWLTDYVFVPLNIKLRDWKKMGIMLSVIINFTLIGLWHGDNLTFVLFGLYHGLLYVPLIISGSFYKKVKIRTTFHGLPVVKDFGRMIRTMIFVTIGFIIFRAESVSQAVDYIKKMFSMKNFGIPVIPESVIKQPPLLIFLSVFIMLFMEWHYRDKQFGFDISSLQKKSHKILLCYALILIIVLLGNFGVNQFIYFQF